jgi:UDP-N-acetylmuramate dehydrogenase
MTVNPLLPSIQARVRLAGLTTIGLGGEALMFTSCTDVGALRASIEFARQNNLRMHILGGGSNTIFSDRGFDGIVIRIELRGKSFRDDGSHVHLDAAAGEEWDPLVEECVDKGFGGVECLSGIPGLVGATPIQNVGAYGQEVSETIESVTAIDMTTLEEVVFDGNACRFSYRQSRFKKQDRNRYVITRVRFLLHKNGLPSIRYPELREHVDSHPEPNAPNPLSPVRKAVLALRRKKSMVIDRSDPNCRSVGSFFMNPTIDKSAFDRLEKSWKARGNTGRIPSYPVANGTKIPAAWLVENSGFRKGDRKGGVGISTNHALALVNHSGTAAELLSFSDEIRGAVLTTFGIPLELEPVVVL